MMSKSNFSILIFLCCASILLVQIDFIYKQSLPIISLPEVAHHTIGDIPFVKEIDKSFSQLSNDGGSFYMATGCAIAYGGGGYNEAIVYYSDN